MLYLGRAAPKPKLMPVEVIHEVGICRLSLAWLWLGVLQTKFYSCVRISVFALQEMVWRAPANNPTYFWGMFFSSLNLSKTLKLHKQLKPI